MAGAKGYKGKITIGSDAEVALVGRWTPSGMQAAVLDGTALGDDYTVKQPGRIDPGQITAEGYYDPADTAGQEQLRTNFLAGTAVTAPKFYYSATQYFESDGNAELFVTNMTGPGADKDDSGLCPMSITFEISGGAFVKDS